MKHNEYLDTAVFCLLIVLGVVSRLVLRDWPNFTAAGAVGLFAGYYFASRTVALVVPMAVLTISNMQLPCYMGTGVMLTVYASMLLPVVLGRVLRRTRAAVPAAGAVLLPAIVFFITTNFAVWLFDPVGMYDRTLFGLAECYWYAVPFFRRMLFADLVFANLLFGAYVLAIRYGHLPRPRQILAAAGHGARRLSVAGDSRRRSTRL